VIFDLLGGQIPTLDGVALRAIRAHLATVNISVAISAVLANIGERRLNMTLHAVHFFVEAAQGIIRFVVIEFGNGADGAPARGSVAIFAGNIQGAVRIPSGLILSSRESFQRGAGRRRGA